MKKTTLKKMLALALVLCMLVPMTTVFAAGNVNITVTITSDPTNCTGSAKVERTMTAYSSGYLTDGDFLAAEVMGLVKDNEQALEIFRSTGMHYVMTKGMEAFATKDGSWDAYVEETFEDVANVGNSGLKELLKNKTDFKLLFSCFLCLVL